jgi:type IV secretion system protein VirB9
MRKALTALISAAMIGFAVLPSQGALVPRPGSGDPRIYVVDYDPTEVVELHATLGFQTFIEFSPDERIENVAVGEAMGWQITPNRKANLLFVKPLSEVPVTNMTVVTNLRHYAFELSVRPRNNDKSVIYTLRFLYPEMATATVAAPVTTPPPPPAPQLPKIVNDAYSYDGSSKILPTRVFDDGHATYFQFREGEEYPAIFSVDADKSEVVVNSYMREGYVAVDRIAPGFVLRQGSEITHIYNDGFHSAVPGPQSPKRRVKKCWMGICL